MVDDAGFTPPRPPPPRSGSAVKPPRLPGTEPLPPRVVQPPPEREKKPTEASKWRALWLVPFAACIVLILANILMLALFLTVIFQSWLYWQLFQLGLTPGIAGWISATFATLTGLATVSAAGFSLYAIMKD